MDVHTPSASGPCFSLGGNSPAAVAEAPPIEIYLTPSIAPSTSLEPACEAFTDAVDASASISSHRGLRTMVIARRPRRARRDVAPRGRVKYNVNPSV